MGERAVEMEEGRHVLAVQKQCSGCGSCKVRGCAAVLILLLLGCFLRLEHGDTLPICCSIRGSSSRVVGSSSVRLGKHFILVATANTLDTGPAAPSHELARSHELATVFCVHIIAVANVDATAP